jgi:hypothetical protein
LQKTFSAQGGKLPGVAPVQDRKTAVLIFLILKKNMVLKSNKNSPIELFCTLAPQFILKSAP